MKHRYIHSSDLLIPSKYGLSTSQIIIISRLIDTERYLWGVTPYFHPTIFRDPLEIDEDKIASLQMQQRYMRFLNNIENAGFIPGSDYINLTNNPIVMTSEGTHRMGWLLSHTANFWIKVRFAGMSSTNPYSENGESYAHEHNMSDSDLQRIKERYDKIYREMNRKYIGIIDEQIFESRDLPAFFSHNGIRFSIEDEEFPINITTRRIVRKYGIHAGFKNGVVVKIETDKATYHYKRRGILISEENIDLKKKLSDYIGYDGWGGITDTITEAVLLEKEMFDIRANSNKRKGKFFKLSRFLCGGISC